MRRSGHSAYDPHLGRIPYLQQLPKPTLRCITKAAELRHKRTLQVTKLDAGLAKADTQQRKKERLNGRARLRL